jgi:DHA1 family inner membrane transport protein
MWTALAATALSQAAIFAVFSYIVPLVTTVAGFSRSAVPVLLVLFGLGTFAGTYLGGRLADRFLKLNLLAGLVVLVAVLGLFGFALHAQVTAVAAVLLFGLSAFVINPGLQTEVMRQATAAPNLASAVNISAFNVGNTAGPWLGGLLIAADYGYPSVTYLGATLALGALGAVLATLYMRSRGAGRGRGPRTTLIRPRRSLHPRSHIAHGESRECS